MAMNYAYKYARIRVSDGLCIGKMDTSTYELSPEFVPIEDDTINYLLKYYYPVPTTVNSFADFQGLFYHDAAHTQPFEEGNAALRHEE